jgi:hypothetical protein
LDVAGSQEAFEEYYHKTVEQIKDDYRDDIQRANVISTNAK